MPCQGRRILNPVRLPFRHFGSRRSSAPPDGTGDVRCSVGSISIRVAPAIQATGVIGGLSIRRWYDVDRRQRLLETLVRKDGERTP